ncbi:MAG: cohesin domain-containing protein [Candidatus Roizmanbacteria bacterium]
MKKLFFLVVFMAVMLFIFPGSAQAITFDLLAPSGPLNRGQDVQFTINVDTEGRSFTSTQIGMTYDVNYLEYVSTSPGTTFTTVAADPQDGGKIVITGSSTSGYTGSGSFAFVTFRIIAQSSGSTELCALYNSTNPTPTSLPPGVPTPTNLPPGVPTPTNLPPGVPTPTSLPRTGSFTESGRGIISGLVMIVIAITGFIVFKKI